MKTGDKKINAVLGAGPAGLSAGHELADNGFGVELFEKEAVPGGISKTVRYKDYYFDLGGHRFFTKYKPVEKLWNSLLPPEDYLTVDRISRIFYLNRFFNYPLKPLNAFVNLGLKNTFVAIVSYIGGILHPIKPENSFKAWTTNKFGAYLFNVFFKTYTEKVWGISCDDISAEWAAQRIKKLSLFSAIFNAFFPFLNRGNIKTLIDQFKYPKYGPGMMYEALMKTIEKKKGTVSLKRTVVEVHVEEERCTCIKLDSGKNIAVENVISTIPITELVKIIQPPAPPEVLEAANELTYRSFMIVTLIVDEKDVFPDCWLYVHSPNVRMGRIQNPKNWSKYMVPDENTTSLGVEFFCNENDNFWKKSDSYLAKLAEYELRLMELIDDNTKVLDFRVIKVPKAYPIYDREYKLNLTLIKNYLHSISNLELAGRYGMFKYNNMDHSILTGILAARNIMGEQNDTWSINADDEYHEVDRNG